ncbi:MAG: RNA 2',3'-cyclic phosphodiesterase [Candidatus Aminicenantes bacterium]|nr:RNA 2',3'-cyclic phosphodiesterase [Candidatus Aminicenantes bacterium]
MRTFIAIDLSPEIKSSLKSLVKICQQTKAEVKWVGENSFHLTLKFLGEIDKSQIRSILEIMEIEAKKSQPFNLECRSIGFFPEKGTPRVIWVGVEFSPELKDLQKRLEASLLKIGFSQEAREFHPHLTLGRVKSSRYLESVLRELKKYQEKSFGQMTVKSITLFESILKPSGAEYRIVQEVKLGC